MNYREKLTWILDKKGGGMDDKYQENIDFVHSLGKKCDCVGWSELWLDEPDADEILDKIKEVCKENGWRARGWYERIFTDTESDWYELKVEDFKENAIVGLTEILGENGRKVYHDIISAYRELSHSPKECHRICVPERFRNACIKHNITDVDFCWVQDKGRYEAEQYFYIYPRKRVERIAYDKDLDKKQTSRINVLGGYLPKIASIFYELQNISLPDCYLREDMMSKGISYVYCYSTDDFCGRHKILIHKDTAELLVKEKALSYLNLTPVCILEKCPEGYTFEETGMISKPTREYFEDSIKQYEKLKAKGRPQYVVMEKDAVKFLRKAKGQRKEDFNKRVSKIQVDYILNSPYAPLLPYYQVCNGGNLSDEYELLSYNDALKFSAEFFNDLDKEELITAKPQGFVVGKCADGDAVFITENDRVVRFSHETFENISEWQNFAQFVVDAIND